MLRPLARVVRVAVAIPLIGVLAAPIASCIPNPSADYEDYVDKTASYRQTGGDGGKEDSSAPTQAIEGTYYASCLPDLAACRVDRTLRFYAESKFVPLSDAGGGGTLELTLSPMKVGSTTVAKANAVGTPIVAKMVAVATDGAYSANFGTDVCPIGSSNACLTIDGAANPLTGRNIVVDGTVIAGIFGGADKFCGNLSGQIIQPLNQSLVASCLFVAVKDGDAIPTLKASEHVCAGTGAGSLCP